MFNVANLITYTRIALIPVFVYFMDRASDATSMTPYSWLALAVYLTATFSDYLDGYLARKLQVITRLGQFLDPLADKLLVGAALVTLIIFRGFPVWAAVIIAIREVAIVMLRSAAMKRGNAMPAKQHAKNKTAVQLGMTLAWLFPRAGAMVIVQDILLYIAVAITVWSGLMYAAMGKKLLTHAVPKAPS